MEKSISCHKRRELFRKLQVPTISEVERELGRSLATVVFKECPDALKKDLGLEPKLKGAGPNLWISPSDLLIGKVCLKPPLTDKHIKALTHEGILEIGGKIEQKFWNEMEAIKEEALLKQEEYITKIANHARRVAIKMARDEEIAACEERAKIMRQEFNEQIKRELDALTERLLEEQRKMKLKEIEALEEQWNSRMMHAVEESTAAMTEQFLEDLEKQKKELEQIFKAEFEKQRSDFERAIDSKNEFCKTMMKQLRHCLECKNLANLMYVLCMERRKCNIERTVLELNHKAKLNEMNVTILDTSAKIKELTKDRDNKQRQLEVREKCLVEILKQFQKFINFALRATPTQAEFLLDVKKMMLFEILQVMVKGGKAKAPHLMRKILPWKSDSGSSSTSEEEECNELDLKDFHNCLREMPAPDDESAFMPAFYYNDKLYVNEDFKVMVGKGMTFSDTNMLWNKDVENLIRILKSSIGKEPVEEEAPEKDSSDDVMSEEEIKSQYIETVKLEQREEVKSEKSKHTYTSIDNVSKKSVLKYSEEKISNPIVYCTLPGPKESDKTDSKGLGDFLKRILKSSVEAEIAPIETTGILAARDSLMKLRESRMNSLKDIPTVNEIETSNTLAAVRETLETDMEIDVPSAVTEGSVNFENFEAIRIPDQLEIQKKPYKTSKASICKPVGKTATHPESILVSPSPKRNTSKESKLLSAVDSIIIHRNSIAPKIFPQVSGSPSGIRRGSNVSRLSATRDSLELIRKQSNLSKIKVSTGNLLTSSSQVKLELNENILSPSLSRRATPVATSYAELTKIPTDAGETSVYFSPITEVYETNVLQTSDSPWKIYQPEEKKSSRDNFINKPNELQLCGDKKSKEHLHESTSFTVKRIHSIMNILREEPSLIRLFTSCTK